jgi:hypothetical protein
MKVRFIIPVLLILVQAGCREEFNPFLDTQMSAVVIEGLLTNLREPYEVRISMATPFDSATNRTNIPGAIVSIKDDLGNSYIMHEEPLLGYYHTDTSEFVAESGRSYALHIELVGGDIYESSVQKLLSPAIIDSIHGIITAREFWYIDQLGEIAYKTVIGTETFLDISYDSDSIIQFRSDNILMKCYTYMDMYTPEMELAGVPYPPPRNCPGAVCPYKIYNWKKFNLNTETDLSATTDNFISNEIKDNSACFFPLDSCFFPIILVTDSCTLNMQGNMVCTEIRQPSGPEGKILETKLYALNRMSSVYYTELNEQLSYEGKLFDPVAVQLEGNITCVNDPNKLALGLFEVSSCVTRSYWLRSMGDGLVTYVPIESTSGLADSGSSKYIQDFWQLIFE